MRLILSLGALFLSVILLQLSSGGVGPLDALTCLEQGFSKGQIGILGSSHFLGFFIGCWWAPRVMGSVGHSRAFAVFTSMGAIGMLGHTLLIDPTAWAVMRVASGLCVAGCYTVIEAWLQAKASNENRGRTMGVYRVADISASLGAQMMIGALATVETYLAYNLLTLFCCATLLPLALTKASPPITKSAPRLRPTTSTQPIPLGSFGCGCDRPDFCSLPNSRANLWLRARAQRITDRAFLSRLCFGSGHIAIPLRLAGG